MPHTHARMKQTPILPLPTPSVLYHMLNALTSNMCLGAGRILHGKNVPCDLTAKWHHEIITHRKIVCGLVENRVTAQ